MPMYHAISLCCTAAALGLAAGIASGQSLPSTFPHTYAGIPNTDGNFSDSVAWQKYFQVTEPLPNVTFPLQRSYAGNLPVNRQGHPNNTLFFWAFEQSEGSLTSKNTQEPWIIWLNGGPGSSSLIGLLLENGPIHLNQDFTAFSNNFSWNTVADTIWIDQPVGKPTPCTGWSTADSDGYVTDEDQMGTDFMGFLSNLVQVFPSLAKRPLYLTGESYAGFYIPYITKTYFSLPNPPVNIRKIAIGDGSYADDNTDILPAVVSVIETYPQLISYDTAVLAYFKDQSHLCGLDINLSYPQLTPIPTVNPTVPLSPSSRAGLLRKKLSFFRNAGALAKRGLVLRHNRHREHSRRAWLSGRASGTINPFYGCDLLSEMIDYALNFSIPWKGHDSFGFDVYYIPDALTPEAAPNINTLGTFLNEARVVAAVHAPTSKKWSPVFTPDQGYPFGGGFVGDPSLPPSTFFSELARNLSTHGMQWSLYSGNADALLPHHGTEIVIQNTTLGGGSTRGFTRKPATPWFDDTGNFAGTIHQEHNLTYVLFDGASHTVPQYKPGAALTYVREFVLGDNPLGTVLPNGKVVGGENEKLAQDVLPAASAPIFFGSGATQGSTVYPVKTIAAWNRFTATVNARPTATYRRD